MGSGSAVPTYAIDLQQLIEALVDCDGLQVHVLFELIIKVKPKLSICCAALRCPLWSCYWIAVVVVQVLVVSLESKPGGFPSAICVAMCWSLDWPLSVSSSMIWQMKTKEYLVQHQQMQEQQWWLLWLVVFPQA